MLATYLFCKYFPKKKKVKSLKHINYGHDNINTKIKQYLYT